MKGPSGSFNVYIERGRRNLFRKSGAGGRNSWLRRGVTLKTQPGAGLLGGFPTAYLNPTAPCLEWKFPELCPGPYHSDFSLNLPRSEKSSHVANALWPTGKHGAHRVPCSMLMTKCYSLSQHFGQLKCITRGYWEIRNRERSLKISNY